MIGPGAYCRSGNVPAVAATWPTLILTTQYSDETGRTVRPAYARRYAPAEGASVWVAWTLTPPAWRDGAEQLAEDAAFYQARGVVLNCEAGWERASAEDARAMVSWFHARGLKVAICSYPWPRMHPRLPWSAWGTASTCSPGANPARTCASAAR